MAANGDGAKPIWMTELGWTTTTSTCARGMWAGQKPSGVTEAAQAANLEEAYHCLAALPLRRGRRCGSRSRTSSGRRRRARPLRPAAHRRLAQALLGSPSTRSPRRATSSRGPCGDFDPPSLTISTPATSEQYVQVLTISAVADRPTSVARMTFQADGKRDPQLHRRRRRLGQDRQARLAGREEPLLRPAHDHRRRARPAGQHGHQDRVQVDARQDAAGDAKTRIKLGKVKFGKGRKASVSGAS